MSEITVATPISSETHSKCIEIVGANMHNLQNVSVQIPRNKMTVVTGVSGSGKSSLIFDTLYAEGQRRYVESLSSYARQFLGKMEKPEVDDIRGLSPCIAIEQKVNTRNPRSTVATSTEIYDYLKLLFARVGKTYSPISGNEVKCHDVRDVIEKFSTFTDGTKVYILTALPAKPAELKERLTLEMKKGFSRALDENAQIVRIDEWLQEKSKEIPKYLLIDRLVKEIGDQEQESRLADSSETAFWEGNGEMILLSQDGSHAHWETFSRRFEADGLQFEVPNVNFLSFNNPYGACKTCEGFGSVIGLDENLVIPEQSLSVYEGAVAPWRSDTMMHWKKEFIQAAAIQDFPVHRAYHDLNDLEKKLLWEGNKKINGIRSFFKFLEEQSYKIQYRVMLSKYKGKTLCPDCLGSRLRKDASYVKLPHLENGKATPSRSLPEVLLLSIEKAHDFFNELHLPENDEKIGKRLLNEIQSRLGFLKKVGVGYLQLSRLSSSLSGGESQRINLATVLGSSLVGSTYILDEPSIGLHPEDTLNLIDVLKELKHCGNTVIVVEHDDEIMRQADHILDIGPQAGTLGGKLVFSGSFAELLISDTLTANYLTSSLIPVPNIRRSTEIGLTLSGVRIHNIKHADAFFPLNAFTAVTGVSGSGKTSLVKGILYPALLRELEGTGIIKNGALRALEGPWDLLDKVEMIDQNPIGKSSRSNPVTYVKAYDVIRDLFCSQTLSKKRAYKPAYFSFNVEGGRCENCQGEGEEIIEMQFMADLHIPCEVCKGKRFKDEILEIKYKDKNIFDVLSMTVDDAIHFFEGNDLIVNRLLPLQEVGLGYVTLGQGSSTLSGGEAQRVKLATYLGKGQTKEKILFIFDEPTTGLHMHDISKLLASFNALIKKGHSIVVIEHNLDVIKTADWVIDLGPGGGEHGGQVLFQGTPENLAKLEYGFTGKHLKQRLNA